ncbi:Kinesin light chain [Metarhizium anisopliae]|nr:Kinesin light chain [Metarhizium anisopliae]
MAGKYVSQTPRLLSNLSAYLDEFRRHRRKLLSETPDELVARHLPEASRLLTLLSFIHYEDIFLELFGLGIDSCLTGVAPWTLILGFQNVVDLPHLEECFQLLEKYSLCQHKMRQTSYSIHRLVHAWGYDRLQGDGQVQPFWYAASQLLNSYLKVIGGRKGEPASKLRVVSHLVDNVQSFRRALTAIDRDQIDLLETLESFGIFFVEIGRLKEAALSQNEVFERRQRILGDEHPDTISAMNNLALTLGDQGKLDEAASMKREVLEKRQRILGHKHPDTIAAMGNLASTLGDQGKLDEAASIKREVLEKRKRILGEEHPHTFQAAESLRLVQSALSTEPPNPSTTKKRSTLKKLTGKLRQIRDLFRRLRS